MARLVMLEIGGLGFVRSIRPGARKLSGDVCVVVADEVNKTLWFWMGSGVQYDKRRTARGKAEQISQEGHRIGDELLGRGFSLVEIDQDALEDPTTANNYSTLTGLLEAPMEISTVTSSKGTLIIAQLQGTAPTTPPITPTTTAVTTPEPSVKETKPSAQITTPRRSKLDFEAALMAIVRVHQQVHIEYKTRGDTEEVIIESIDGLQHKMKRSKGRLSFNWDPKTPKELKELVAHELKSIAG
ncbi:MAG: hypothetical protein ACFE89_01605 [Candidatus Hodarchaeota archaeon]